MAQSGERSCRAAERLWFREAPHGTHPLGFPLLARHPARLVVVVSAERRERRRIDRHGRVGRLTRALARPGSGIEPRGARLMATARIEATAVCGPTPVLLFAAVELGLELRLHARDEGIFLAEDGRPGPAIVLG